MLGLRARENAENPNASVIDTISLTSLSGRPKPRRACSEGLDGPLRLGVVVLEAFSGSTTMVPSGLGMFFGDRVLGSWLAPLVRWGLCQVKYAQAHVTYAPSRL